MSDQILDIEKILGFVISGIDFSGISPTGEISYSWGDQDELNQWMVMKDKEISGKRAFGVKNNSKYPLIWMVTPIEGETTCDGNLFADLQLIVAMDTKPEWLNSTRENETMPKLVRIANHLLSGIDQHKNASILKKNGIRKLKFKKIYNYQEPSPEQYRDTENRSATLDPWDVVTLKFDLLINDNCLKTLELCL